MNKKSTKVFIALFTTLLPFLAMAQETITGTVTDVQTGAPLPGATVQATQDMGTVTDEQGAYSLEISDDISSINVSYVGYIPQDIPIEDQETIDVQLAPEVSELNQVVVVGYGTARKSDLTGSVSSVNSEEINALPNTSVSQALSGRAAGVQVTQNSGSPGGNISVRIRGSNSLLGNNEPLYVVDGFPINGKPTYINPNDIEGVEVLKDASATAIYGSRGANGVVIITTKTGKVDNNRIEFDTYTGFQEVRKTIDLLDAQQYATIANERSINDGGDPTFSNDQIAGFGKGTDWQDAIFRQALISNYVLTFSGGTDKTQYSVSGSWFDQEGIVIGSEYQRGSLRANLQHQVKDWLDLSLTTVLSRTDNSRVFTDNGQSGNSVISAALLAPPTLPLYNEDGSYTNVTPYSFSPGVADHPVKLARERRDDLQTNDVLANLGLDFHLHETLDFKVSLGIESNESKRDFYSSSVINSTPQGEGSISSSRNTVLLNDNILTYTPNLDENNILKITAGSSFQKNRLEGFNAAATGFANDILLNNNLGAGDTPRIPGSSIEEWTLVSFLGRVNYSFKDRYLVTASFRADGSSRFGAANKWGYFPSAALAWKVSNEPFLQDSNTINNLKIRASWGETGNTAITPYQTLAVLTPNPVIFNDDIFIGFAPDFQLPNPDLKWETTTQFNVGIDLGLWSNRITLTADYYNKDTSDLLATVPLPSSVGYARTFRNVGEINNKGVEFALGADVFRGDFSWDISANLAVNRNEVISLAGGSDLFGANLAAPIQTSVNIVREGEPVGVFYGFVEEGLDENGQIIYEDRNGDGEINLDDKTIIGDPNPDFTYGINSNIGYKGFELSVFLQGVEGADIFNFNASQHANSFNSGINQIVDVVNRWTPDNPNPNAPYPIASASTNFRESDRYVEDGSYLRFKNIKLAYNVPCDPTKMGITDLQVYLSGQNLITITDYSWYDPEVSTRGGQGSISPGIDQFGYPTAKTYTVGFKVGF